MLGSKPEYKNLSRDTVNKNRKDLINLYKNENDINL